jgi:hypothetical protein
MEYYPKSYNEKREFLLDESNWLSKGCYGEIKWAINNCVRVVDLDFLMMSGYIKTII